MKIYKDFIFGMLIIEINLYLSSHSKVCRNLTMRFKLTFGAATLRFTPILGHPIMKECAKIKTNTNILFSFIRNCLLSRHVYTIPNNDINNHQKILHFFYEICVTLDTFILASGLPGYLAILM